MTKKTARALALTSQALLLVCSLISFPATAQIGPGITVQPVRGFGLLGTTTQMSVAATGSPPLFYQWQYTSKLPGPTNNIPGATNAISSVYLNSTNQTGTYRVLVANAFGRVTSTFAQLYVQEPLRFPTNQGALGFSNGASQLRLAGGWFPYAAMVEASCDLRSWSPLYTNFTSGAPFSVTDSTGSSQTRRFYRASARLPLASFALVSKSTIDLHGNNILTDSFDSTSPAYSGTGGRYDPTKHKANGGIVAGTW